MFIPLALKIPSIKNETWTTYKDKISTFSDKSILFSPYMSQPLFKLGFHSYISRTRSAMNKLETKNNFYYNVVNQFEINISDYNDSIENLAKMYFGPKNKNLSDDFFKHWEICYAFNIIQNEKNDILNIQNNDIDDSIYAYILFVDKILNKDSTKIKHNSVNIDKIDKIKKKYNIIIANAYNTQKEQNNYNILLNELLVCITSLEKNGHFILRIFDSFTYITVKLLYIISTLFEQIYIYKPFLSRTSEPEKFIICKNFKATHNKNFISNIENIINKLNVKMFLNDIFIDFDIPNDFLNFIKFMNIKFVNNEQIQINEIIKYIRENNYYGDKYHTFKNAQIEATNWWINTFFPHSNNIYKVSKDTLDKLLISSIESNNIEKDKLISLFI
jgi:hypothetical protein